MMLTRFLTIIALVAASQASTSFLVGTWKNELGSLMTIDAVTTDNVFSGTYKTAVSGNGTALEAPVRGSFNPAAATAGTIAFIVDWQYVDEEGDVISATAWCGLVRGKTMLTKWLLTHYCDPADDWQDTNIGMDTFNKI